MSGRLENDSFKLLELKLNLGNMADKIQNAYETSKNIYDDVLTQGNIFSKLYIKLFWSGTDDNDRYSFNWCCGTFSYRCYQ